MTGGTGTGAVTGASRSADALRLVPVRDALPDGFPELATEALTEGYDYLGTLADDWRSGAERFTAPGAVLLAAWQNGALAGVGGLTLDPYEPELGALRVRRFYVAPAHRGTGVGRRLAGVLLDRGLGAAPLLTLRAVDARAAAFWESLGFRPDPMPDRTHLLVRPAGATPT